MTYNRIEQGECIELMKRLPDASIDMILCDLPYGTTACKWDSIIPFDDLWEQYHRVIKNNGAIVLFSAQPFTTKLIHSNINHYKYNWYWIKNNKTGHTFAKYQPMRQIEDICVFYKKAPLYNPQGLIKLDKPIIKRKKGNTEAIYKIDQKDAVAVTRFRNYPSNLLHFNSDTLNRTNRLHPTQKPVALLEYLIKTYTNEGDIVLDNCMGSGSTCVAALNTGRRYIGFELEKKYFEIAQNRIEKAKEAAEWQKNAVVRM